VLNGPRRYNWEIHIALNATVCNATYWYALPEMLSKYYIDVVKALSNDITAQPTLNMLGSDHGGTSANEYKYCWRRTKCYTTITNVSAHPTHVTVYEVIYRKDKPSTFSTTGATNNPVSDIQREAISSLYTGWNAVYTGAQVVATGTDDYTMTPAHTIYNSTGGPSSTPDWKLYSYTSLSPFDAKE